MQFETFGDKQNPAILFFHAMGVTGASSEPVARHLQDRYFCILPTSTGYCAGQTYRSKVDEIRQIEQFLQEQNVPQGHFPFFEGHNHMQYQISDPAGFANMLISIMEQDSLPELPFVRKGEHSDEI